MRSPFSERLAWALIALLVAFWLWFGVVSAVEEQLGWPNVLLRLLVVAGLTVMAGLPFSWGCRSSRRGIAVAAPSS